MFLSFLSQIRTFCQNIQECFIPKGCIKHQGKQKYYHYCKTIKLNDSLSDVICIVNGEFMCGVWYPCDQEKGSREEPRMMSSLFVVLTGLYLIIATMDPALTTPARPRLGRHGCHLRHLLRPPGNLSDQ